MRAIVFLCLLQAAFGQIPGYNWQGGQTQPGTDTALSSACQSEPATCGCCLMQKQMKRMEQFFNLTVDELTKNLMDSKTSLNNVRASRSVFSVALNNAASLTCVGPFSADSPIVYKHVFINLGNNYNAQTGVFTVPRTGIYSLAVTMYSRDPSKGLSSCANLLVNGKVAAPLVEKNGLDDEDSSTVVAATRLNAGDKVSVNLLSSCNICDDSSHFNTFTGFLLFAV